MGYVVLYHEFKELWCGCLYQVEDELSTSPEADDIMGQMMLTFRYANAQKSSADTGMRVKDTAQKLVEQGKFMGGKAPYGYQLEYSGEVSKHGRALKHLVVIPERAGELVRYIYSLSFNKEFGSSKIAQILNKNAQYKELAPNGIYMEIRNNHETYVYQIRFMLDILLINAGSVPMENISGWVD